MNLILVYFYLREQYPILSLIILLSSIFISLLSSLLRLIRELYRYQFLIISDIQIVALAEISIWNGELEQLPWESLGVAVLLWHSHNKVISTLSQLRLSLELSITQWVEFNEPVVWIDILEQSILNDQVKDEEETAANLNHALWLTSCEDD